jgi:dimethylhistidine N-methyltransferase
VSACVEIGEILSTAGIPPSERHFATPVFSAQGRRNMTILISHPKSTSLDSAEFLNDVLRGLSAVQRSIPSKYFYDSAGSSLFDQICELDEYYPTRTETAIMEQCADQMANALGQDVRLVEFGSGASVKTRVLIDHLIDPVSYVPVDISGEHLLQTADELSAEYPLLDVSPIVADFMQPFKLPTAKLGTARTCVYFPGSTIGNFRPPVASRLLRSIADCCDADGGLLIGFDLQKDPSVIEDAYNDRLGVTAEFNKNLLRRINRELGADFDVDQFEHVAFYNEPAGRVEMRLLSSRAQRVSIAGDCFDFQWGESILTEYSHKYTMDGFEQLAMSAGWTRRSVWTDDRDYFAVMYLEHSSRES